MTIIKDLQKRLQSPDSFVSLILGVAVVLVVGTLVYNYFTNRQTQVAQQKKEEAAQPSLPLTHTVKAGETLWSIAQTYYKSGYNWVDIAKANNLTSSDSIEVGQTLTIPASTPMSTVTPAGETSSTTTEAKPAAKTYTVVRGDNLWNIAVAKYGSGYKWVDIARANALANPDIIHAGNVFVLP